MKFFVLILFSLICSFKPCGVTRWDVKNCTDTSARLIISNPVIIPYSDLFKLDTVKITSRFTPRLKSEYQIYSLTGYLKKFKLEQDNDFHLCISPSPYSDTVFICELPDPDKCIEIRNSIFAERFRICRIKISLIKSRKSGFWFFPSKIHH